MSLYSIPGKTLQYFLHHVETSKPTYDMHGDKINEGGVEIGVFGRTTPSGRGKTVRCSMAEVIEYNNQIKELPL
jgi:hypothetical protein